MHIVLIGMPGSGKSTLGKAVAKRLAMAFLDTDDLFEEEHGDMAEYIKTYGNDSFLKAENNVVKNVKPIEPTVIATGGSVPLSAHAMKHLKQIGTVIYICTMPDTIAKRLSPARLARVSGSDNASIKDIYEHRKKFYERYVDITFRPNEDETIAIEDLLLLISQ